MAIQEIYLYRNQSSTDTTVQSGYTSNDNFPDPATFGWSFTGHTFKEWNSSRDGTGFGYSIGTPVTTAMSETGAKYLYYAIWQVSADPTYDSIITRTASVFTGDITNTQVSYVASGVFYNCSTLTGINLPNCTTIYNAAFYCCENLSSLAFPACTTIGNSAFRDLGRSIAGMLTVSFSNCSIIGDGAFSTTSSGYAKISAISFPKCTTIGQYAFAEQCNLISAAFPSCLYLGRRAFADCTKISSFSFPKLISILDDIKETALDLTQGVFRLCNSLTTLNLPACTYAGSYAFTKASALASISLPICLAVGESAFFDLSAFSSLFAPKLTTLAESAFAACPKLSLLILSKVTELTYHNFCTCSSLTTLYLAACSAIADNAFISCSKLTSLYLLGSTVVSISSTDALNGTGITSSTGLIYVLTSMYTKYTGILTGGVWATEYYDRIRSTSSMPW